MVYLIQGFFFFERLAFGIGYDHTGARAIADHEMLRTMFAGMFGSMNEHSPVFIGRMTDHYGESELTSVDLKADSLRFTKRYNHRKDSILYRFDKVADGTWAGLFTGKATGTGQAHCILTAVPEGFLIPATQIDISAAQNPRRPVRKGGPHDDSVERYRK